MKVLLSFGQNNATSKRGTSPIKIIRKNYFKVQSQNKTSLLIKTRTTLLTGGKARNIHKANREELIQGHGSVKLPLSGFWTKRQDSRKGIEKTDKKTLHAKVKENREAGANLFTGEWRGDNGSADNYAHEAANHSIEYVRVIRSFKKTCALVEKKLNYSRNHTLAVITINNE